MSDNRIINDFIQLAKLDSVSFQERSVADKIKELLAEIGIEAYEDNAADILGGNSGNVYAVWQGDADKEPILLSAHMDTVVPGIKKSPVIAEDGLTISSDGTAVLGADDIAGVVEIIEGIRRIIERGDRHRTVELLFPVAEEVYTKGAAVFDYSKLKSKEAYCLDLSGDVGIAAIKAPSLISFSIKLTGKASHAGFAPDDGINAIMVAAKAISEIRQGRVDDLSTVNIGKISGGMATNIVPELCVCEGEVRSFNHDRALELVEGIKRVFEETAGKYNASVEFEYIVHFKAYEIDSTDSVVTRFVDACEKIGVDAKLDKTFGGSDNNQFNAHGISGIVLACGMENVHTVDEYIKTDNLYKGAEIVEQLILA